MQPGSRLSHPSLIALAVSTTIACAPAQQGTTEPGAATALQSCGDSKDDPKPDGGDAKTPVTSPGQASACAVQGTSVNWAEAKLPAEASQGNARKLRVAEDANYLYLCVEGTGLKQTAAQSGADQARPHYEFFIDTDGDPATGLSEVFSLDPARPGVSNGPDFKIADGLGYKAGAQDWNLKDVVTIAPFLKHEDDVISLRVAKADLPRFQPYFSVGFRLLAPNWSLSAVLPERRHLARVSKPEVASSKQGLIIPLYALPVGIHSDGASRSENCEVPLPEYPVVSLGDLPSKEDIEASVWGRLARAAQEVTRRGKEFWVVVSGPDSQPFKEAALFDRAKLSWEPIRESQGEIFGYVSTLVRRGCSTEYRRRDEVLADVARWKANYPEIAGIWLDEFYPRYEYAGEDSSFATFPNGPESAPSQLRGASSSSMPRQIEPSGGYYAQLTRAIRDDYPGIKLIGNAGGSLPTNQLLYSGLLDVLCSFEQSYDTAVADDWRGLTRAHVRPDRPMLALVHSLPESCSGGACPRVEATLARAFEHGFSYFFVSDQKALWQDLPAHLDAQIKFLTGGSAP